jgi:HAMP domain-containing protein
MREVPRNTGKSRPKHIRHITSGLTEGAEGMADHTAKTMSDIEVGKLEAGDSISITESYHRGGAIYDVVAARPITPARGEPMPRTIEHYIKRGDMDQELILKMKDEISRLKAKVNKLEQRISSKNWSETF